MGTMKSVMTYQNVTANSSGTDTLDVTNPVPLEGKEYYGTGNGTFFRVRPSTTSFASFISTYASGYIAVPAATINNNNLNEPPSPKTFTNCRGGKKIKVFDPSEIRKSTLFTKMDMSLDKFLRLYQGNTYFTTQRISTGQYKFFGFEKLLQTGVGTTGVGTSTVKCEVDVQVELTNSFVAILPVVRRMLPVNITLPSVVIG